MSSRNLVIFIIIGLAVAGWAIFKTISGRSSKLISPTGNLSKQSSPTALPIRYFTYNDPAGFKFSYPDTLTATSPSTLRDDFYSQIELKSQKYQGAITIVAKNTNVTDLNQWLINNKIETKTISVRDLKLADLNAKQFANNGKTTTVALDQGVEFTVLLSATNNPAYWITAYNKILGSFAFVDPVSQNQDQNSAADTSGSDAVEYEGEEVIE